MHFNTNALNISSIILILKFFSTLQLCSLQRTSSLYLDIASWTREYTHEEDLFLDSIYRRDALRALFTRPNPIPLLSYILFVFISWEPAVICCDEAASTGGARVSRVEGHTLPFLLTFEERAEERRLWYICNHVTRYVPFRYNCSR